ncbi:major facilitator superfamily domain-containing protein [Aspergillus cavernicola]|uniref:Major facilitator superfamily domain-containing protein n=1 Tax=Aspergillus cavernicola TaxID=176166 RepID=A0ABR4I4S4_9EURO
MNVLTFKPSTALFVQGTFGYILIPLHVVSQTFGQGHDEANRMTWHVGGYSLTVGTFLLIAGKLGDLYGSKRILIIGWTWFGVWSVIAGCSAFTRSQIFVDTARALQGIGPTFLLLNTLAIAGRTYPPGKKKNMIFSAFAMAAPLGCSTAGIIGAAFAEYLWWPWVIWLYSIGCFVIAGIALWIIPPDSHLSRQAEGASFDCIGFCLGVDGLLLLNISWNQAPVDGWSTPDVYVLLILGFPILGLFVFCAVLLTAGLSWSSFGIWFYYPFQSIQQFRHVSPLESAVQFVPGAISGITAAIATPYLMSVASSDWLMAIASPVEQSYWMNTFWSFVITAWGMDISFSASATTLSDAVPIKHEGASASLVNTVINYLIAIGLGIAGTVEAEVSHDGEDLLTEYRAALWTSVGLTPITPNCMATSQLPTHHRNLPFGLRSDKIFASRRPSR